MNGEQDKSYTQAMGEALAETVKGEWEEFEGASWEEFKNRDHCFRKVVKRILREENLLDTPQGEAIITIADAILTTEGWFADDDSDDAVDDIPHHYY